MENMDIEVRAHQQMKAAIQHFSSVPGCKTIILQGYADEERLTIGANIPINLADGQIKLSAWMLINIRAQKCTEDWCISVDTSKLAKRMPKIEGDKEAFINFEYSPKEKNNAVNIVFDGRGTAGKKHKLIPQLPLPGKVNYLPMTFDDVTGEIHFYINTGGSEGMDIHILTAMHDYGNVLEARAILSKFLTLEAYTGNDTEFSKKAPKAETAKTTKTSKKKKEKDMSENTPKTTPLPTPPPPIGAAATTPVIEPAAVIETPAVIEDTDTVVEEAPAVIETPAVVEDTETTGENVDAASEDVPPQTDGTEPPPEETAKKKRASNKLADRLERAIKLLEDNNYAVSKNETEDSSDNDPTIANKLDEINKLSLQIARLSGEINGELAKQPELDLDIAAQIKALAAQL